MREFPARNTAIGPENIQTILRRNENKKRPPEFRHSDLARENRSRKSKLVIGDSIL